VVVYAKFEGGDMTIRVGVNGFGRIGRLAVKAALIRKNIDIVAVNDLTDGKTLAHLFKYDSTFGIYPEDMGVKDNSIIIKGKEIKVLAEKDPGKLPWKDLGVEYVIESTGKWTDAKGDPETGKPGANAHIKAGARKVIISAPAKNEDGTFVMGVNENKYDPSKHNVISNASCTTNCLAPVAKVLMDNFGISKGLMTTIHSYTNDQSILDFPHKDLRRARAGALSMIPTSTGAAKAIGLVIPELKGKMDGFAIRVPTPNVSVVDLTVNTLKTTSVETVNDAFRKAAAGPMGRYLEVCDVPLVSRDFNGSTKSAVVDAECTKVINDMVKVIAWYDNEWGYSLRLIDLLEYIAGR
jgi:glyceraldehyde 3-phosphate dehydrogenase